MIEENEYHSNFIRPEISLQECRNILCQNGEQYTDEEIKEIRALLLKSVEIDFYYFNIVQQEKSQQQKVIDIIPNKEQNKPPFRKAG